MKSLKFEVRNLFFQRSILIGILTFNLVGLAKAAEITDVAPGNAHLCVLSEGKVECWGVNSDDFLPFSAPVDLPKVISLKSGAAFSCGILENQSVRCWGSNKYHQLEVPADLGSVKLLAVGVKHACTLNAKDQIRCWGDTSKGEGKVPEGLKNIVSLTAGYKTTCAIDDKAEAYCWGFRPLPEKFPLVKKIIRPQYFVSCAILMDDTVKCWNNLGEWSVMPPNDLGAVKDLTMGPLHSCALTQKNEIRCWEESYMHISTGQQISAHVKDIESQAPDFISLSSSSGTDYSCALKKNGGYTCWGLWFLKPPKNLKVAKTISGMDNSYCATDFEDHIHCWGSQLDHLPTSAEPVKKISQGAPLCFIDQMDQLRCGKDADRPFPGLAAVKDVSIGLGSVCTLNLTGQIICRQRDEIDFELSSPIGRGPYTSTMTGSESVCGLTESGTIDCYHPRRAEDIFRIPANLENVKSIKSDGDFTGCALLKNSDLHCFGGDLPNSNLKISNVIDYTLNNGEACALSDQHDISCWPFMSEMLTAPPLKDKALAIAGGGTTGCAILEDKSVKCWSPVMHSGMD